MAKHIHLVQRSFLSVIVSGLFLQTVYAAQTEVVNTKTEKSEELYTFDPNLFKGSGLSARLIERFNHPDQVEEGTYTVDIYVNERFIQRQSLYFSKNEDANESVQACLSTSLLETAGIIGDLEFRQLRETNPQAITDIKCLTLAQVAKGSQSVFDFSLLRLNFTVPQSFMKNIPRGYVNPSELNAGSSIAFINYTGNYYHTENRLNGGNYESAFMSLNGGLNFGKWQYRQQSNISMDNQHNTTVDHIRSYVQRPIDALQSQLVLGQQYTSGRFLSGLSFKGLSLMTDERMRPDSMRGYAPVIRGIAQSNAKVSVEQNGREIYQLTVAPGPFEISDLYPTNFDGNLTVIVTEADGSKHSTEVPYAAVPTSLRSGLSNYSIALGKTDLNHSENAFFSDLNYERGLNNNITLNSGLRLSNDYQAVALGSVYGSNFGALGSNLTYSRARLPNENGQETVDGWMANLTYSKTIQPTNTTIAIAGYRYSTIGYREFSDVLGLQYASENGNTWTSNSYLQQSRFQVNISQQLGDYGTFYLAGATQSYRDGRNRDTSFQAGYNKSFGIVSLNLNYTRQKTYSLNGGEIKEERFDNFGGLSLHIPLGRERNPRTPTLSAHYNRSNDSDNYQLAVNGALDQDYSLNYNLGVGGNFNDDQTFNAGLYKRFSNVQLGLNTSYNDQYWQKSMNVAGAVAFHSGGITFGPYLGETFALIEAKGAKGAKVVSSPYSKVDRFGYALVPNINPFRFNNIALDPSNMANNIELDGGEQRIAPYAGATVKLNFKTRKGYSVLIQSQLNNQQIIPMGADVFNQDNEVIGMVGQAGQVYVRVPNQEGILTLRWGAENDQSCQLPYHIENHQLEQTLIKLNAECRMEN